MTTPVDPDGAAGRRRPGKGEAAPDFELPGTGGGRYHLGSHRGEVMVLAFYPADDSPVCTQQLRSYDDDLGVFAGLGATIWCLSPQGIASHERFAERLSLHMPLLADEDKQVGASYGILGPLGFYRRSVFVVDHGGIVRFARRSLTSMTYMPAEQLADVVREVAAAGPPAG